MKLFSHRDRRSSADLAAAPKTFPSLDDNTALMARRMEEEWQQRETEQAWERVYPFADDPESESALQNRLHRLLDAARHQFGWRNPLFVSRVAALRPDLHERPLATSSNGQPLAYVLDVGCGTGAWAAQMAHFYRNAYVIGIDRRDGAYSQVDARTVGDSVLRSRLTNFARETFDLRHGLLVGPSRFDLIHMRQMAWAIPRQVMTPTIMNIARRMRDGGWLEVVEPELPDAGSRSMPALADAEAMVFALGNSCGFNPRAGHPATLQRTMRNSLVLPDPQVATLPLPMSLHPDASPLAREAAHCYLDLLRALRDALSRHAILPRPTNPEHADPFDSLLAAIQRELADYTPTPAEGGILWRWNVAYAQLNLAALAGFAPDERADDRPESPVKRARTRLQADRSDPALPHHGGPLGPADLPFWLRPEPAPAPGQQVVPPVPPSAAGPTPLWPASAPAQPTPPGGWQRAADLIDPDNRGDEVTMPAWMREAARPGGPLDPSRAMQQLPRGPWWRDSGSGERR